MGRGTSLIQLVVLIILFFVIFFGIAFILNMLLRRTWMMTFIYLIIVLLIVNKVPITEYFTKPGSSFSTVFSNLTNITPVDIVILASGLVGTIASGVVIKLLRKSGYQMF